MIMKKGFTLIEMLVVIGILAVLIGASLGGYSAMTKTADRARCQELVSNVATALTALYQNEGVWPRVIRENGASDGKLDNIVSYAFVSGTRKYFSLTKSDGKLGGHDRFGIISPWAAQVVKKLGSGASLTSKVGSFTVDDHILQYAVDLDGDGIILDASVGGKSVNVRATAIVWCCGKDGVLEPYPYGEGSSGGKGSSAVSGSRCDDVYSWTPAQTRNVQ
ncbi:MAG: type II secretion system protein [Kiritimatiellae bacterium]|nr:type II secretion system protein [Kiritimatiellia bacterium]